LKIGPVLGGVPWSITQTAQRSLVMVIVMVKMKLYVQAVIVAVSGVCNLLPFSSVMDYF
jgi:hypothetical protein